MRIYSSIGQNMQKWNILGKCWYTGSSVVNAILSNKKKFTSFSKNWFPDRKMRVRKIPVHKFHTASTTGWFSQLTENEGDKMNDMLIFIWMDNFVEKVKKITINFKTQKFQTNLTTELFFSVASCFCYLNLNKLIMKTNISLNLIAIHLILYIFSKINAKYLY